MNLGSPNVFISLYMKLLTNNIDIKKYGRNVI